MANVAEIVTTKIIELLEQGVAPWKKGWSGGLHRNFAKGNIYHGFNVMMLELVSQYNHYIRPLWLTYDQCASLGGQVKKGEHATNIIFSNRREKKESTPENPQYYWYFTYYRIFNVEQCDGLTLPPIDDSDKTLPEPQAILDASPLASIIHYHAGGRAFYNPREDKIVLPAKTSFDSGLELYSTAFHECVHATGHPTRLNRKDIMHPDFGSELYAKEELIAEIGSAIVCHSCGLELAVDNQAAYCQAWLKELNNDRSMIISAANRAERAADYILNKATVALDEEE